MENKKTEFQKRLEILMIMRDVSNEKLAEVIGVNKSSISNYKSTEGRMPSLESIIKMADYFGVTIDFLLGRTGDVLLRM